jgi:hypothetical protein
MFEKSEQAKITNKVDILKPYFLLFLITVSVKNLTSSSEASLAARDPENYPLFIKIWNSCISPVTFIL